jgi:DNA sulfur modification protein DndD
MKLKQLNLRDFRTYGGHHTFDLLPSSPARPIILVGGLNGAGKTTFLDALQLALYGIRANCASRGSMSYKDFLRKSIHRNSNPADGACVELAIERGEGAKTHELRISRSWSAHGEQVREHLEVYVDGKYDKLLSEQWDEQVDDIAPHRISHLFCFDGEKIKDLSEEASSKDVLKTALHALFGLDLIDRLIKDLELVDRDLRKDAPAAQIDEELIVQLRTRREEAQKELELRHDRAATLRRELDQAIKEHAAAQEQFRAAGGEWAERKGELEAKLASLEAQCARVRDILREQAAGVAPLLLLARKLEGLSSIADQEMRHEQSKELDHLLAARDEEFLSRLAELLPQKNQLGAVRELLHEDRSSRAASKPPAYQTGLDREGQRLLQRLVEVDLGRERSLLDATLRQLLELEEERQQHKRRLESVPERDELADIQLRRSETHDREVGLQALLRQIAEEIVSKEHDVGACTKQYMLAMQKAVASAQGQSSRQRKRERVLQATTLLTAFRSAVLESNLNKVQAEILYCFQRLIRKPNLVEDVRIDPATFELALFGPGHRILPRSDLSAGETQLLAVSMLWGLGRVAGIPLPVVIDTPLGRLDSKHRGQLIDFYFPHASHQVLLLSTDEEIQENRMEQLRDTISRSYTLEYMVDEDRTVARPGYFWS